MAAPMLVHPFIVRGVTCVNMIPLLFTILKVDGGSEETFSVGAKLP